MVCTLIITLLATSVETLLSVDFPDEGSAWNAGDNWESTDDSFFLYLTHNAAAGGPFCFTDSLVSPGFTVPEYNGELVVVFDHYWFGHGHVFEPQEWAKSTSKLIMITDSGVEELWEISEGVFCSDYPGIVSTGYELADSGLVYTPLFSVDPGDCISFSFIGMIEGDPYSGYVSSTTEWDLFSFSILCVTEEAMTRSSWGAIKASL